MKTIGLKCMCVILVSYISVLTLSSCDKKDSASQEITYIETSKLEYAVDELQNTSKLDFSNAIIDVHNVDKVYSLNLTRPQLNMETLTDEFVKNCGHFINKNINKNDLKYRYTQQDSSESKTIKYNDSPKFNSYFTMLSYYDEETKNDVYFQPYSMYWVATKSSIYEKDIPLGDFGKMTFAENNTSETKNDIEFLTEKMNEINSQYSYFLESEQFSVKPYRYINSNETYYALLRMYYENIPFNTDYFYSIDNDGEVIWSLDTGTFGELVIDKNDEVYRIVSMSNLNAEEREKYTEIISPETACNLVNEIISDDVSFEVTRFELLYNFEQIISDKDETDFYYNSNPHWKITIEKTGIPAYPQMAFMVDAITGNVKTYKIG